MLVQTSGVAPASPASGHLLPACKLVIIMQRALLLGRRDGF
ncbi:hypothetical protein [Nocardia concava]|nr:hypothetical protein [Nocardia concava]